MSLLRKLFNKTKSENSQVKVVSQPPEQTIYKFLETVQQGEVYALDLPRLLKVRDQRIQEIQESLQRLEPELQTLYQRREAVLSLTRAADRAPVLTGGARTNGVSRDGKIN